MNDSSNTTGRNLAIAVAMFGVLGLAGLGLGLLPASAKGSPCDIAEIGGHTLTLDDARAFQAAVVPAPTMGEAIRLTVDATLAHVGAGGQVNDPVREKLNSYGQLVTDVQRSVGTMEATLEKAQARLDAVKANVGLALGPCYEDAE